MVFLDLLSYGAMLMFAGGLLLLGTLLLRVSTQRFALDFLFGAKRGEPAISRTGLSSSDCYVVGLLLCAAGGFLVFCIVRGVASA